MIPVLVHRFRILHPEAVFWAIFSIRCGLYEYPSLSAGLFSRKTKTRFTQPVHALSNMSRCMKSCVNHPIFHKEHSLGSIMSKKDIFPPSFRCAEAFRIKLSTCFGVRYCTTPAAVIWSNFVSGFSHTVLSSARSSSTFSYLHCRTFFGFKEHGPEESNPYDFFIVWGIIYEEFPCPAPEVRKSLPSVKV